MASAKIFEVHFGLPIEKEVKADAVRFVFDGYAYQIQEDLKTGSISVRKISTTNKTEQLCIKCESQNKVVIR